MKVLLFWFICFVVYSFLGWICETFFCSVAQRRFVNRGFLNGPFCPIYGFGALLVIGLFSKYENDLLALFLLSMTVTSIVEYIASVLLEKLFHLTLWDYSGRKWNINGRVCLRNSLLFGLLSVLMVKGIHPQVVRLFADLPEWLSVTFVTVLSVYFVLDVVITVLSLTHINRVAGQKQLELDSLAELRNQAAEQLRIRGERFWRPFHNRLLKAFPNMTSRRFPEGIKFIRETIKNTRKK
ncbi:MAG: putative ABC transporter permease [Oscillospiraceae bacterium]